MSIRLIIVTGLAVLAALWAMPGTAHGQVSSGDLFASVNLGGTFNNPFSAVFQYAPDGTHSTFVPNLNAPRGLAFDSNGNFFVVVNNIDDASNVNASVLKIPSGGPPFASFPTNFFATGLAIDGINNVFVIGITFPNGLSGDAAPGGTIYKIKADGSPPNTFASLAGGGAGLAFDSHGNLFATDDLVATDGTITPAIDKLTSEGMMTPFAGPTAFAQYPGAAPGSLAFDASGNLFVGTDDNAPDGADIIVKISPTGTVSTVATGLTRPRGLAFDSSGNLFVAEVPGDTFGDILKFTPGGTGTVGNIVVPNSDWGVAYFDQGSVTGDFTGPNGRINNRGPYNLAFPPNTPASSPGSLPVPVDIGTVGSATDITLTFPSITTAGTTMATPIADPSSVGPLPTGIDATNALAFGITTTAKYTTPIIIAVQVLSFEGTEAAFDQLQVLHWNGASWDNVTASDPARDFLTKTIYASTSSLSPFVVAKETLSAQVQQPINLNGSSVFSVKRGVVPVVFTLTSDGVATCQLPAATISVTRTAGAVLGSIDESTYLSSADKGSNFRISNCQYVYNLAASSLGIGTYKVNISIGGTVVGSGTFALK